MCVPKLHLTACVQCVQLEYVKIQLHKILRVMFPEVYDAVCACRQ